MRAPSRLWRTGDGRLVLDGDPAASVLAYGPGDEVTAADTQLLPRKTVPTEPEAPESTEVEPEQPEEPDEEPEKAKADEEPEKKAEPAPTAKRQRGGRRKTSEGEGRW